MKRVVFAAALVFFFAFLFPKDILATSGCCSYHGGVAYCNTLVGRYVCNDGTYSPSCGCSYIPTTYYKPTPTFPSMTASWNYSPNQSPNQTFNINVTLDDSNPTQYSAVLSKCKGCNPGPLTDFYSNKFTYNNVAPGTWHLNVKKNIGGVWSTVSYWEIKIPSWVTPTPISTPVPTPTPTLQNNSKSLLIGGFVAVVFLLIGFGGIYLLLKFIARFLKYAKEHDGVWSALFWIVIIIIWILVSIFSGNKKTTSTKLGNTSKYKCNCSKTCPNMTCEEAHFQLNECGCSARDGDGDGIPCEEQCR